VPLSGLDLGTAGQSFGSLRPGVTLAPDGSRYYVAHADRAVLDVVDIRAPRLERLERSVSLLDGPTDLSSPAAWLRAGADGAHLYVWHATAEPDDDVGLQMVDVGTWRVQTVDPIAIRLGPSLDGQWLFRLDPAFAQRPGAQRSRDPSGARLSVLDASGRDEVAVLAQDRFTFAIGQYSPRRLYVLELDPPQPAADGQGQRRGRPPTTLVAFASGSWGELARRPLDTPGWLVTTEGVW
jgi:hypothetical protein